MDSENFTIKDSGERKEFTTGAVRDTDQDKPRFDLIPITALRRLALHYALGGKKYEEFNWAKGIPMSRCFGSLLRHAYQFGMGDTEEDHLSALIFNAMCIMHYQETDRNDLDDMFDWRNNRKGQCNNDSTNKKTIDFSNKPDFEKILQMPRDKFERLMEEFNVIMTADKCGDHK